jgi:hypothetical protein
VTPVSYPPKAFELSSESRPVERVQFVLHPRPIEMLPMYDEVIPFAHKRDAVQAKNPRGRPGRNATVDGARPDLPRRGRMSWRQAIVLLHSTGVNDRFLQAGVDQDPAYPGPFSLFAMATAKEITATEFFGKRR